MSVIATIEQLEAILPYLTEVQERRIAAVIVGKPASPKAE